VPSFQFIVSAARHSWTEKNKDAPVHYVRALASAYGFMRDPGNRDEVIRIIVDTTGSSEEIARLTKALYFEPDRGVVPKQGEIDIKGLSQVIQLMAKAEELNAPLPGPERFVYLQYLQTAGLQ
jgi:ABC-type nitrate/sulfonate/bicarbonate transport system substrate-binding protein